MQRDPLPLSLSLSLSLSEAQNLLPIYFFDSTPNKNALDKA